MSHAARSKLEGGKVKDLGGKKRYLSESESESEPLVNGDLGTSTPLGPHSRAKHPRRLSESNNHHHQPERERANENMVVNGVDSRILEQAMKTPVVLMQRDPTATAMVRRNELTTTAVKRKSMGAIPEQNNIDHGDSNSPLVMIRPDVEDQDDKRRRHFHRIAQRNRVSGSPGPAGSRGTPVLGRKSMGGQETTQTLDPSQLRDYYGMCMKMSTENKIHGKTAFDLHLIDYISQLIQTQTDANRVDFKLASGALDLGAKIYCNRVDFVHTEAQKVASGLMLAADDKKRDAHNDADDDPDISRDDGDGHREEDAQKKRKRRERKRNAKTIAQNIETLNIAKVECNVETDPIFHRLAASFDMGVCNGALMSNLEMGPDGSLLIDSKTRRDEVPEGFYGHTSPMASIARFEPTLQEIIQNQEQYHVCLPISRFIFSDREQQIEMEMGREQEDRSNNSYAFDLHAELSEDEQPVDDPPGHDMTQDIDPETGAPSNGNDSPGPRRSRRSIIKAMNLEAMEDLIQLLSEDKPNEYGYFNKKVVDAWAGPNHWRIKRLLDLRNIVASAKTPRKRKKKEFEMIDFFSDEHDFNQVTSRRKLEELKSATLRKWSDNAQNEMLPEMESFTLLSLARPFNKPESTYHCLDKTSDEMLEITNQDHNYFSHSAIDEPPMSPRGLSVESDDDAGPPAGFGEAPDEPASQFPSTQYDSMPFTDSNMVDVPFVLSDLNIQYARVAKKIDVRKLKRAMWDSLLTPTEEEIIPPTPVAAQDQPKEKPKHMGSRKAGFSQIYEVLPKKISPLMAANLSAPIAFVTLLHIANEKNLKLIGSDDLADFLIEQEPIEEEV